MRFNYISGQYSISYMCSKSKMGDTKCFLTERTYAFYIANIIKMKGEVDFWMEVMLISFISIFLKYSPKINTIHQQKLDCNVCQKSDILAYFALVPLCRSGNIQFLFLQFSMGYLLVHFHCIYLLLFKCRYMAMQHYCMCAAYIHPRDKYTRLK